MKHPFHRPSDIPLMADADTAPPTAVPSGAPPAAGTHSRTIPEMRGFWNYVAAQTGSGASIIGALLVAEQHGSSFKGSLVMRETDEAGVQRERRGVMKGRLLDTVTLEFEVIIDGWTRRHLATLSNDLLTGEWLQQLGEMSISGAFGARRAGSS